MRTISSAVALASAGVICQLLHGCHGPESVQPNLLLITVDGLRGDRLDCHGGKQDLGAEVCGLGESGARYVWAFSTASSGAAAAASLLTSQYPSRHGVGDSAANFLRRASRTLTEALREGRYATAAFVSSPELNRSRNFQQGFDVFDDWGASRPVPDRRSLGEAVLRWSAEAPLPWFLWVHYSEPHGPFESAVGEPEARSYEARYEGAIRQLDRRLSQLIAVLDAQDAALGILLAGLHGQALGENAGRRGHGHSLSLEQIRVPMLWRPPRAGPGRSLGRRITTPVSLIDVAPTLLKAAGIGAPESFEGEALPYHDPPTRPPGGPGRAIFAEHRDELAVIQGSDYGALPRHAVTTGRGEPPLVSPGLGRAARLWPAGDRSAEQLPDYDDPATRSERLSRLAPRLAELLSDDSGALPSSAREQKDIP